MDFGRFWIRLDGMGQFIGIHPMVLFDLDAAGNKNFAKVRDRVKTPPPPTRRSRRLRSDKQ